MSNLSLKISGILLLMLVFQTQAQTDTSRVWNNRKCAVVLTYDDGLNVHLDKVIPVLDSLGFKATFYVPGNSPSLAQRLNEWRAIANNGHELGNHTLFHPCYGNLKGREWVKPEYDLNNYSMRQMFSEIRLENTLLEAIDGKKQRTFAYTCGDCVIGDSSIKDLLHNDFVGARGIVPKMEKINEIDLFDIGAYLVSRQSGEQLIELVKKARDNNALIVFLFQGVGGEHSINISLGEHNKLLRFLKENEKDIWIAPLAEISEYVKKYNDKKY